MNIYLNRISPPIINLNVLKNREVRAVLEKFKRYRLELYLLDITTDIGIPSYLSIIIDRTGLGPSVSLGAKSGFDTTKTILGAINESFMVRLYVKYMLKEGTLFGNFNKKNNLFVDRAEYWFASEKLDKIGFLLSGKPKDLNIIPKQSISDELKTVSNILKKNNLKVYYKDVTHENINKLKVYKVIMPDLQPLYLIETDKDKSLNRQRLKKVADFFHYDGSINPIPHPFL